MARKTLLGMNKTKEKRVVSEVTVCQVGVWDGVMVAVVYGNDSEAVWLELSGAAWVITQLAEVVAGSDDVIKWCEVSEGGARSRLRLLYSECIDSRLVALVDLAAAIRYAVPGVMQLRMVLTPAEAEEFEVAMEQDA